MIRKDSKSTSESLAVLLVSLQDMRDAMKSYPKRQRWSWDEIEAFMGGAMVVRGVDIDTIMRLLRG